MTTLHRLPAGDVVSFTKGATDVMLEKADTMWINGELLPIDRNQLIIGKRRDGRAWLEGALHCYEAMGYTS